jgi:hypothetical protein
MIQFLLQRVFATEESAIGDGCGRLFTVPH